jgi:hypothetical protein
MKKIILLVLLNLTLNIAFSQQLSLKEQAIDQFKKENYPLAISLMEKALIKDSNDAEIYYYLGVFNHYNANDSRPLQSYDSTFSNNILDYLDKALEINPQFGDAKYFYLTECAARASIEYQKGNLSNVKLYFDKAYKRGAIPEWAIELGENILNSCERNAILFTHGDFIKNVCFFVQLHFKHRTDISVVPLTELEIPSFVMQLEDSESSKVLRGVKTGLNKEQIMQLHPFKWDTLVVSLEVPDSLIVKYSLQREYTFDWKVEPDLSSNRIVAKIQSEIPHPRTYLSPTRAVLLSIIETNKWERPVSFTNTFETYYLAGLEKYFQDCGLVYKLLPLPTENTQYNKDIIALENIVLNAELKRLRTILENDMPRATGIALYRYAYYTLADFYLQNNRKSDILKVIEKYKQNLSFGYKPELDTKFIEGLENMKNR